MSHSGGWNKAPLDASVCRTLLQRASAVTTQLKSRSALERSNSSIETMVYLRAARECASDLARCLSLFQQQQSQMAMDARSSAASHVYDAVPFSLMLQLQQAKQVLLQTIGTSAAALDTTAVTRAGRLSRKDKSSERLGAGEELAALLRTRKLLAAENMKMDQVVSSVAEGSAALATLYSKLGEVDSTLTATQSIVRSMLKVQSIDDLILRVTWLCFFATVLYIWSCRLLGLGDVRVL